MRTFTNLRCHSPAFPLGLALLLLCTAPEAPAQELQPAAQTTRGTDDNGAETIRTIVDNANHPYLTWPDFPRYQDEMEGLYVASGYDLVWLADGRMTKQASDVIEMMDHLGINQCVFF